MLFEKVAKSLKFLFDSIGKYKKRMKQKQAEEEI